MVATGPSSDHRSQLPPVATRSPTAPSCDLWSLPPHTRDTGPIALSDALPPVETWSELVLVPTVVGTGPSRDCPSSDPVGTGPSSDLWLRWASAARHNFFGFSLVGARLPMQEGAPSASPTSSASRSHSPVVVGTTGTSSASCHAKIAQLLGLCATIGFGVFATFAVELAGPHLWDGPRARLSVFYEIESAGTTWSVKCIESKSADSKCSSLLRQHSQLVAEVCRNK